MPTESANAARREIAPHYFPGETAIRLRGERDFADARHWAELASKHINRYVLPTWAKPCEPEAMRRWLDRLDLTEKEHERMTATPLAIFIELNPTWPLRAWIGIVLETVEEKTR